MNYSIVFLFCCLTGVTTCVAQTYSVFAGKTGNGKSYIVSLRGCPSETGSGTQSTTKNVVICKDVRQMDMVGLDDDGKEYVVKYNGQNVTLSGFSFPVYNLFDALERETINDVQFFLVFDANNMKLGSSSAFFVDFVQNDLKCPLTRVLNKYRPEHPGHRANLQPGDQTVAEFATSANVQGTPCRFALVPEWRKKIIEQDLIAVRSMIDPVNCDKLVTRKRDYEAIQNKLPQSITGKDCSYMKQFGTYNAGGGWSVNIGPVSFGKQDKTMPLFEKAVDEDCVLKREATNAEVLAANEHLHQEKLSWIAQIAEIEKGLAECRMLPNWTEKNPGKL